MIFKDCVHLNYFYFSSYYNYVSHSRYYCCLVYIKMLKIHSGNTSPVEEHVISSPQLLQCCSFLNTSMTPNCLFIIEITGDFSRIKWQVIKFSLWLRGGLQWCCWSYIALSWRPRHLADWLHPPAEKHLEFRTSHWPRPQPRNKQSHSSLWLLWNLSVSNISE